MSIHTNEMYRLVLILSTAECNLDEKLSSREPLLTSTSADGYWSLQQKRVVCKKRSGYDLLTTNTLPALFNNAME